jgi:hypothetical protein
MNQLNNKAMNELKGFPQEIIEKMLYYQEQQGNKRDVSVFEKCVVDDVDGFVWRSTPEGYDFWQRVILQKDFDHFFERYPKPKYPRVMMVSLDPITEKNKGYQRVVFMEKCGKFIAWNFAETIEDSETVADTTTWIYAADIPHPSDIKEVTLEQVAEAMNIPVDKLRIRQ